MFFASANDMNGERNHGGNNVCDRWHTSDHSYCGVISAVQAGCCCENAGVAQIPYAWGPGYLICNGRLVRGGAYTASGPAPTTAAPATPAPTPAPTAAPATPEPTPAPTTPPTAAAVRSCEVQNFGSGRNPPFLMWISCPEGIRRLREKLGPVVNSNLHCWGGDPGAIREDNGRGHILQIVAAVNLALGTTRFQVVDDNDMGLDTCAESAALILQFNAWLTGPARTVAPSTAAPTVPPSPAGASAAPTITPDPCIAGHNLINLTNGELPGATYCNQVDSVYPPFCGLAFFRRVFSLGVFVRRVFFHIFLFRLFFVLRACCSSFFLFT